MPSKPRSTGEAIAKARQDIAAARLADPDEHFPYRLGEALAAADGDTLMGPGGPEDDRATGADFMTERIARATGDYIDAQEDYLGEPSRANRERYEQAKDDLTAARKAHRRSRLDADGRPIGAIVADSNVLPPAHQVGPRLRRVGEE
jgi:hypothetical protein